MCSLLISFFFFFNDTATTEIYTLSLHDALPIWDEVSPVAPPREPGEFARGAVRRDNEGRGHRTRVGLEPDVARTEVDRKSTRLNSSHSQISYAVFCLKKKQISYQHNSARHVRHH